MIEHLYQKFYDSFRIHKAYLCNTWVILLYFKSDIALDKWRTCEATQVILPSPLKIEIEEESLRFSKPLDKTLIDRFQFSLEKFLFYQCILTLKLEILLNSGKR